jgi:hypothetical protein
MFHIRPNKAGLYTLPAAPRPVAALATSAFDKNVRQDRYLSSPRRALVDIATSAADGYLQGNGHFVKMMARISRAAAKSSRGSCVLSLSPPLYLLPPLSLSLSLCLSLSLFSPSPSRCWPRRSVATFNLRRGSVKRRSRCFNAT